MNIFKNVSIFDMSIIMNSMKHTKIRFIQLEFYTIHDEPSDYMVIIEVNNDVPSGTIVIPLPTPYTKLPRSPYIMN